MATQTQPTTALVNTSPLILELAAEWKMNASTMINTLKATVFPQIDREKKPITVTDAQLMSFLQVANAYKLNPFLRELYAFPTKGGGIVPMVPVDGWSNLVNRNPMMDGVEFVDEWELDERGARKGPIPFSTTCIIYRKDRSHPTKVTEYFAECNQPSKEPWVKWPSRMLRHKAFVQCARIAFSLAGIYDPDEAERIAENGELARQEIKRPTVINATHTPEPRAHVEPAPAVHPAPVQSSEPAAEAQPKECLCSCCKNVQCECISKDEVDQCGCANCQRYMQLMRENPEVKTEAPAKPEGPYVPQERLKKLFAICASAGIKVVKDSHDDELHKKLKEKWNVDSVREIPESLFDAILKDIAPNLKVK